MLYGVSSLYSGKLYGQDFTLVAGGPKTNGGIPLHSIKRRAACSQQKNNSKC